MESAKKLKTVEGLDDKETEDEEKLQHGCSSFLICCGPVYGIL
jgi:hypothetical protein